MRLPATEFTDGSKDDFWYARVVRIPPGPGLDSLARTTGASERRRGVRSAADLLRVALCYGFCGLSLELACFQARLNGSGRLSPPALLKRLRKCGDWLEEMVTDHLTCQAPVPLVSGLRMRAVDTTRVAPPGSKGGAWRIHVSLDVWSHRLVSVEVTDGKGGEHFRRFAVEPGDLMIGDRAYAQRRGLAHVLAHGGHFLVRLNWKNMPLLGADGREFRLLDALRKLPVEGAREFTVFTAPDKKHGIPAMEVRLVAMRRPREAAEKVKKKLLAEAKKQGRTIFEKTLELCEYICVLTSVDAAVLDAKQVLEVYRLRWQVELEFKKLKSLLGLAALRAKNPSTIRAVLLAKLFGALLVEDLVAKAPKDGYAWQHADWKLTTYYAEVLRQAILGQPTSAGADDGLLASLIRKTTRKRQPRRYLTRLSLSATA